MEIPRGYCDLRVERINDHIVNAYVEHGYSIIALNTTVNCSTLGIGTSNRKKRKHAECNDEKNEENEWVPVPKRTNYDDSKLTILNRLTIQITNIGQLQKIVNFQNFKLYNIFAVEPLNDQVIQDIVNSPYVDILTCNIKVNIHPKEYSIAVAKKKHFEISYAQMLSNYTVRQETFTLAHLLHIKGKSKNVIVSSGAANKFDVRNPHDVMNLGILLGFPGNQSKESITRSCHSVIIHSYGRKLGKCAIHMVPAKKTL